MSSRAAAQGMWCGSARTDRQPRSWASSDARRPAALLLAPVDEGHLLRQGHADRLLPKRGIAALSSRRPAPSA